MSVKSYAAPYIDPYYDTYLAPQVDKARPYVGKFNESVYAPGSAFAKHNYQIYGAPRVAQARKYAEAEWERTFKPQLDAVQTKARAQYEASLGPYVSKASAAVDPYYSMVKSTAVGTYGSMLLPAYTAVTPYAQKAYSHGHNLTVKVVFPYMWQAQRLTFAFVSRKVWPQVRILYGENVEPQLMRISERLGRYKDGKKLEAAFEAIETYVPIVYEKILVSLISFQPFHSTSSYIDIVHSNLINHSIRERDKPGHIHGNFRQAGLYGR